MSNTLSLLDLIKLLSAISMVFYIAAVPLHIWAKKTPAFFHLTFFTGFAVNVAIVVINTVENGYVPFVTMYQVMTFISMVFYLTFLFFAKAYKAYWMGRYFALAPIFFLTGSLILEFKDVVTPLQPILQSPFFFPHISLYMLSYALCAVAFIISIVSLFTQKPEYKKAYNFGIYRLIAISFPFMTTGMMVGAIWANQAWGNFWSWDIKENWSLITWLFYGLYLHLRRIEKFKKYAIWFAIAGFVALLMTLIGVNIIGVGRHAYS